MFICITFVFVCITAQTHVCVYYYKISHALLMGSCIALMFGLYALISFALQ